MALIFDIETDGFLEKVTKIHCLVIKDTLGDYTCTFVGDQLEKGLQILMESPSILSGHNVIKYDIAVIQKLYPWFKVDEAKVFDTLVASRLIHSDLRETDGAKIEKKLLPNKLWASHSLKAWGYRLGVLKGEFKEENGETAFDVYTPEMLQYCIQDVEVTHVLFDFLQAEGYSTNSLDFEHKVAWRCAQMERSGWPFDEQAAGVLYSQLVGKREAIRIQMSETFEPLVIERISEKTGKTLTPKVIEFNPASRDQIAQRLATKYGWVPKKTDYTPSGKPKIDEDILSKLDYPEAKVLAEYFLLEKRIGQLSEGAKGWLQVVRNGHIHASLNTNGAVTGRTTCNSPNLQQVPGGRSPYGKECRSLFGVRKGFSMVGVDLSGLELRCLAHFMYQWDGGEYANEVLNGDVHTKNQLAAGLPTRDNAKTFIYGFLYGAGDEKVGSIVGKGREAGKKLKDKFLAAIPALKKLREAVTTAGERGYLKGLDGRRIPIRHKHASLNSLLQGAGAAIAKKWLLNSFDAADAKGLKYGWDGDYTLLGFIHDELGWAVREGKEEAFAEMVIAAARKAGEDFNFKCPIDAESKIGANWYECH